MKFDRNRIINNLLKELSPFEKRRKIESLSFWCILCVLIISFYGIFINLGVGNPLLSLIFFFTFFLFLILAAGKHIYFPASNVEDEIASALFTELTKQTLTKATFKPAEEIPVNEVRESKLFFDYIHYLKGYKIAGNLNQQQINIYQLNLQKEEKDSYYEGIFMTGKFVNPFKSDVFIYHTCLNEEEKEKNADKAYYGTRSRSGTKDHIFNTLDTFCFKNVQAGNWGYEVNNSHNHHLRIYTTNRNALKRRLTKDVIERITLLFHILPDCQMYISFRGNSFYVGVGTKKLFPFEWRRSLTKTQTIEKYAETYLKLIEIADILMHLHVPSDKLPHP